MLCGYAVIWRLVSSLRMLPTHAWSARRIISSSTLLSLPSVPCCVVRTVGWSSKSLGVAARRVQSAR